MGRLLARGDAVTRALGLALVLTAALAAPARADDEIVKGAVVSIEHREIYINLGTAAGLADNTPVRIKRPIKLRHPITRAPVEDWIPVGSAAVTQVGAALSRVVVGELVTAIKVGDVVEVLVTRPDRAPPPPPPSHTPPADPATPAPVVDPAVKEVVQLFTQQSGQPVPARIAAWEYYLSTHATSPFAAAIRSDLAALAALADELKAPTTEAGDAHTTAQHDPPKAAALARALPIVVVLDHPEQVASAYLHYRVAGARTYRRLLLTREHDVTLRGAIPAASVAEPGVEYFVEVSGPGGQAALALASPKEPIHVDVAAPVRLDAFAPTPGRSTVKLAVDYLDFATLDKRTGNHTDHETAATIDFTYALDRFVESVGVGYGVYSGQGGSKDRDWANDAIATSAFHYGYADVEVGGTTSGVHLGVGAKLLAGVGKEGFGMGGEGRLRIGRRDSSNLLFVANTIAQVGFLSEIRFGTHPLAPLLVGVSVGATDQPTLGDVALKLGSEFEYLISPRASVILRGSWQGRSVAHGGLGGGAGVGFSW